MRIAVLGSLAALSLATVAHAQTVGSLRFGEMTPPGVPGGETFQRITGDGPYFVYGLEADDGIKRQTVSFVAEPIDPTVGDVDIQFNGFARSVLVDPDSNINATGKGVLMIVDFEKVDSTIVSLDEVEEEDQSQQSGVTRVPVIYWPWWLIDYEDGSVGAEGTRILCVFGHTNKYTDGKRLIVVLLDGDLAVVQHALLPDGYLDIDKIGRGFELEWGTNASGDDELSVNGKVVNASSTFKVRPWQSLTAPGTQARIVELLKEYHAIRKSPTAKP